VTVTLVLLAIIMATVIGWLLKQSLNTQPWLANAADDASSGPSIDTHAKTSGLLILASIAYHWTRSAAVAGRTSALKPGLAVAGLLTFLFLAGQLVAWQQVHASGYYLSGNPANAFFYMLTAVHGLHMLGGMWVWARSMQRVFTGADAESVRLSIELCTVYWHYLLLVWVVLFALLLST
jgi:cytochrome c oxidase subunit 3